MFQNGNINISGFQLINKESRTYWSLRKQLRKRDGSQFDDVDVSHYSNVLKRTFRLELLWPTTPCSYRGMPSPKHSLRMTRSSMELFDTVASSIEDSRAFSVILCRTELITIVLSPRSNTDGQSPRLFED